MQTFTEYRTLVKIAAQDAETLQKSQANAGKPEPMYLYARHSTAEKRGALRMVSDSEPAPDGWQLVTPEPLRISTPYDRIFTWIYDRARNQPILRVSENGTQG